MCRTDDRRPFGHLNPTSCRVLEGLFDDDQMLDMPLHERHMKLREEAFAGRVLPSIESDLLAQLGSLVHVMPQAHLEGPVVATVLDLSRITCVLDNFMNEGLILHFSTEVSYQMFLAARGTQDVPVGIDQLKTAYRNCWLNHRRERIVWEGEAAQEVRLHPTGLQFRTGKSLELGTEKYADFEARWIYHEGTHPNISTPHSLNRTPISPSTVSRGRSQLRTGHNQSTINQP
ncbi:hypothetical protein AUP68_03843 [Ilyonectria robusta]